VIELDHITVLRFVLDAICSDTQELLPTKLE